MAQRGPVNVCAHSRVRGKFRGLLTQYIDELTLFNPESERKGYGRALVGLCVSSASARSLFLFLFVSYGYWLGVGE